MFKEVKLSEEEMQALCDREPVFPVCMTSFTYYRDVENPDRILAVGIHKMTMYKYIFLFEKNECYAMRKKAGEEFVNMLDRPNSAEKEKEILDIYEKLSHDPRVS